MKTYLIEIQLCFVELFQKSQSDDTWQRQRFHILLDYRGQVEEHYLLNFMVSDIAKSNHKWVLKRSICMLFPRLACLSQCTDFRRTTCGLHLHRPRYNLLRSPLWRLPKRWSPWQEGSSCRLCGAQQWASSNFTIR